MGINKNYGGRKCEVLFECRGGLIHRNDGNRVGWVKGKLLNEVNI